jgi:hypothetical protein
MRGFCPESRLGRSELFFSTESRHLHPPQEATDTNQGSLSRFRLDARESILDRPVLTEVLQDKNVMRPVTSKEARPIARVSRKRGEELQTGPLVEKPLRLSGRA